MPNVFRTLTWIVTASAVTTLVSCSGRPPRLEAPAVQPANIAKKALELYDRDGDGRLAGDEFSAGIKAFAKTADEDSDGTLTEAEISKRLLVHVDSKIGLQDVGGIVYMSGRPLPGATVKFIPDEVFGDVLDGASGTTASDGFVELVIEGNDLPGVNPGFYRIEVTKTNNGREQIPAQYNTESKLGEEIGPNVSQGGWKLELKQR